MQKKNHDYVDNLEVNQFVELLTSHQSRIQSYILSLVPNFNDAEDIMQETSKMMWNKFKEFEIGTNFMAWSMKIAFYRVMEYRRNNKKNQVIHFDHDLINEINQAAQLRQDRSLDHLNFLQNCVKKLPRKDRQLLIWRYDQNLAIKEIAGRLDHSVQSVYQKLARIYDMLLMCVQRTSVQEGL